MTTDDFAKYHHDHVYRSFLDPLTTLRAEVERLREDAKALLDHVSGRDDLRHMYLRAAGAEGAYRGVLDLIDKHAREGQ